MLKFSLQPVYRDVMAKEHEVIMLLNKGRDTLSKSPQQRSGSDRNLQRDLEKIQQTWEKLRKETVDRNTRLQTCMVETNIYIFFEFFLTFSIYRNTAANSTAAKSLSYPGWNRLRTFWTT